MPESNDLIPVGKIVGTHGIKGLLKVLSFSGNFESLHASRSVTLKSQKGELREFELEKVIRNNGKFIFGLKGFDDINQVIPLIGYEICLLRSQLPETEEDEYYWCDLIGLEVITVDGETLGTIADIFEAGSSDIYVVQGKEREYLIPAIADVINKVDLKAGKMLVTPLEGLLDL